MNPVSPKSSGRPRRSGRWGLMVLGTVLLGTSVGTLALPTRRGDVQASPQAAAQPASPMLGAEPSLTGVWIGLTLFAISAAVIVLLSRKARLARDGNGSIHLVDTLALGGRRMVHLIRVDDRKYLIGNSERGVSFLSSIPQNAVEAEVEDLAQAAPASEGEVPFATYLSLGGRQR